MFTCECANKRTKKGEKWVIKLYLWFLNPGWHQLLIWLCAGVHICVSVHHRFHHIRFLLSSSWHWLTGYLKSFIKQECWYRFLTPPLIILGITLAHTHTHNHAKPNTLCIFAHEACRFKVFSNKTFCLENKSPSSRYSLCETQYELWLLLTTKKMLSVQDATVLLTEKYK